MLFPTAIDERAHQQRYKIHQAFQSNVAEATSASELSEVVLHEVKRLYRASEHGFVIDLHNIKLQGRGMYASLWTAGYAEVLPGIIRQEFGHVIDELRVDVLQGDGRPPWIRIVITFN